MSKNPYTVLGVSPNADDEEIKRVYRELARKYHPDRYADSDLADLASEKMKEINAAYEEIQRIRAGGGAPSGASGKEESSGAWYHTRKNKKEDFYTSGSGTSYQNAGYSEETRDTFIAVRNAINGGRVEEAERMLSEMPEEERVAEWHFLMGCVAAYKGFYVDAQREFDTAYRMEPTNNEYWSFREKMHDRARQFDGGYRTSNADTFCDVCSTLICADCCCECMGGDLIPCC